MCQLDNSNEPFALLMTVENGKVRGGISTSNEAYLNLPEKVRLNHFEYLRKHLESKRGRELKVQIAD